MTDVVVAIREPLVRLGLRTAFESAEGIGRVDEVLSPEAIADVLTRRPDAVVLLDVAWRREHPDLLGELAERFPAARVVVYVAHSAEECILRGLLAAGSRARLSPSAACRLDECCLTSLRHRARGCLPSDATPAQAVRAVRHVAGGDIVAAPWLSALGADALVPEAPRPLTVRELDVMALLAQGHGNKGIARRLGIKEQTVKNHLARVMRKTGLRNRVQLGVMAARYGLDRAADDASVATV